MLSKSEVNLIIRRAVVAFLIAIIGSIVIYVVLDTPRPEVIVTSLVTIFGILFVPPFLGYIEQAFEKQKSVAETVRQRLKTVWIDGYLSREEHAITSSSGSANARNPEVFIEDPVCELPVILQGYNNESLDLKFCDQLANVKLPYFDFADDEVEDSDNSSNNNRQKLYIDDNESLITIFNQFSLLVREDDSRTGEFIVVLGSRGTLKTIQLLKLAEYLVDRDTRVPIYLNLFSWAAGSQPFHKWLYDEIRNQYDILLNEAKDLVEGNYLILLLDGFDEVPFNFREYLVRSLTRFLKARINQGDRRNHFNGKQNHPIDLRDAVVITSVFPPQWDKSSDNPDDLLVWDNLNHLLDETSYKNFLDLNLHIKTLTQKLQDLEDRIDIMHKAPVAVVKIKPLEQEQVTEYIRCHFRRKVIQGIFIYYQIDSEEKLETSEISKIKKRKIDSSIQAAPTKASEALRNLKGLEIAPQLMAVLQQSPFLLRAFISTYSYDLYKEKLYSPVIDGSHYGDEPEEKTFHKITEEMADKYQRLKADIPRELKSLLEELQNEIAEKLRSTTDHNTIIVLGLYIKIINEMLQDYDIFFQTLLPTVPSASPLSLDKLQEDINQSIEKIQNVICKLEKDIANRYSLAMMKFYEELVKIKTQFVEDKHQEYLDTEFKYRKKISEIIIKRYVEAGLRSQPDNVGPLSELSRREMLELMAKGMETRHQRVLDQSDVVFYLEDIGQRLVLNNSSEEDAREKRREFSGYVTLMTVFIFFMIYGFYLLVLLGLSTLSWLDTQPFSSSVIGIVALLFLLFARNFAWHSSDPDGNESEDRTRLNYPIRWHWSAGISAGFFMGIIVGLLFFGVSEVVYGNISRQPLRYEAVIVCIFSFALFFLLGGLELGRRYAVVARPEDGKRFLLLSTVFAGFGWLLFFFTFLFWPRTRFDLLTPAQINTLIPTAIAYSLVTGIFLGVISALVFAHLYIRHLFLFSYLRIENNLQAGYQQVLEQNVEAGFLRRVGGGYIFRHKLIMDYFSHTEVGLDNVNNNQ